MTASDETRADTGIIGAAEDHDATLAFPAIGAAPRPPAIACGPCGETFAQAGFGGRGLFLAETLHAAAVSRGWIEDPEGAWTCDACLAKADAPPAPEPEPAAAEAEPAPVADPYDQSIAILAELDAKVPGIWDELNRSNNATAYKNSLRFGDGHYGFEALFTREPDLREDPEAAVALLNYEADLAERMEAMHRASLERREAEERALEERLAALREQPAGTEVAA